MFIIDYCLIGSDGTIIGRNVHDCHFPSCPELPSSRLPGFNDIVQIKAVADNNIDLCMNVRSNDYTSGAIIEFYTCKESDSSQHFYVRRAHQYDDDRWYIQPVRNTNLYVTATDVNPNTSRSQGKMKLKRKGGGDQIFFTDFTDAPYDEVSIQVIIE